MKKQFNKYKNAVKNAVMFSIFAVASIGLGAAGLMVGTGFLTTAVSVLSLALGGVWTIVGGKSIVDAVKAKISKKEVTEFANAEVFEDENKDVEKENLEIGIRAGKKLRKLAEKAAYQRFRKSEANSQEELKKAKDKYYENPDEIAYVQAKIKKAEAQKKVKKAKWNRRSSTGEAAYFEAGRKLKAAEREQQKAKGKYDDTKLAAKSEYVHAKMKREIDFVRARQKRDDDLKAIPKNSTKGYKLARGFAITGAVLGVAFSLVSGVIIFSQFNTAEVLANESGSPKQTYISEDETKNNAVTLAASVVTATSTISAAVVAGQAKKRKKIEFATYDYDDIISPKEKDESEASEDESEA